MRRQDCHKEVDMKRAHLTLLSLVLLFSAPVAKAQNKLDGVWNAALFLRGQRCRFNLVNSSGQRYTETLRCGSMMTSQSGTYVLDNGTLVRTVVDWEPKRRYVLDNGYSGHYEDNAKPPGGSFKVNFISRDTTVWRDVQSGGTLTYRRGTR